MKTKQLAAIRHRRIPLVGRTLCGLNEFELPNDHGIAWQKGVTCAECLRRIAAKIHAPHVMNKALVVEHFARQREVKQAQKAGAQ